MRKMTREDVEGVVELLRKWQRPTLRWQGLQKQISLTLLHSERSWSRQSLQASESINIAWLAAKRRLANRGKRAHAADEDEPAAIERLEAALSELQTKYDNLSIRHRQLIYNAALLPGGTRLLLDPLPDNTPVQSGPKTSRRK